MILIADGGSTKTNWCFLTKNGSKTFIDTEGYNPYFVNTDYIINSLNNKFDQHVDKGGISEVHFYGAGCFPDKAFIVKDALEQIFKNAFVYIELDLLAACRALLGSAPGFAAILGTGTNTCIYDGETIAQNIDSLGYILGDEGSGSAMGKKLLSDYVRDYLPGPIKTALWEQFHLTKESIFNDIYASSTASPFCASFTRFINDNIHMAYFYNLVTNCFRGFFENLVCHYTNYQIYSFNCIGSIGFTFQKILGNVASEFGMKVGTISQSPINGLVSYHINEIKENGKIL